MTQTLNIHKQCDGEYVVWYDGEKNSRLSMGLVEARDIMQLAMLSAECQVRLENMTGDETINFINRGDESSMDDLISSYVSLSSGGGRFQIHSWSPQKDGV